MVVRCFGNRVATPVRPGDGHSNSVPGCACRGEAWLKAGVGQPARGRRCAPRLPAAFLCFRNPSATVERT